MLWLLRSMALWTCQRYMPYWFKCNRKHTPLSLKVQQNYHRQTCKEQRWDYRNQFYISVNLVFTAFVHFVWTILFVCWKQMWGNSNVFFRKFEHAGKKYIPYALTYLSFINLLKCLRHSYRFTLFWSNIYNESLNHHFGGTLLLQLSFLKAIRVNHGILRKTYWL